MSKFYRRFNSSVTNVETHNSLISAIDAATSNADYTIYIGNESDTYRGLIDTSAITTIPLQAAINDTFDTDTLLENSKFGTCRQRRDAFSIETINNTRTTF